MVVRMARGFASLEFPSTYTMLRDSLVRYGLNIACFPDEHAVELVEKQIARQQQQRENEELPSFYLDFSPFSCSSYIIDMYISKQQRLSFPRTALASLYLLMCSQKKQ
jgi:hypothetical protein